MTAAFLFNGTLREVIHRVKYRRARHLVVPLVGAFFQAVDIIPAVDLIVPVPLHPTRLASRGYNQADLIARAVAGQLDCPLDAASLTRVRDTASQVSIDPARRWENVRGAFVAPPAAFVAKRVLIVDDVATTASTLRAAADAVAEAGAASVDALVIARAATDAASGGTGVASYVR